MTFVELWRQPLAGAALSSVRAGLVLLTTSEQLSALEVRSGVRRWIMRPPADDDGAVLPAPHAYASAGGVLIGLGPMNDQGDVFDRRFYITAISAMTGQQLWFDDYLDVEPRGVLFFDGAVVVFETLVHRSRERSWLELHSYGYEVLTGVPVHTRALSADVDTGAERLKAGHWAPRVVAKRLGKIIEMRIIGDHLASAVSTDLEFTSVPRQSGEVRRVGTDYAVAVETAGNGGVQLVTLFAPRAPQQLPEAEEYRG